MLNKPLIVISLALFAATGCSSSGGTAAAVQAVLPQSGPSVGHPVSQYISHVVVIVQENRSFENFFAGYPGANAPTFGCSSNPSGARRRLFGIEKSRGRSGTGCPAGDQVVPLHAITFDGPDLKHDWHSSLNDWNNGLMDGFWEYTGKDGQTKGYAYVDRSLIQPYWKMAQQWVLADAMFPTEFGGSFTAHLTLVAGNDNISFRPSSAEVDFPDAPPDDCDSPPGTVSSYITKDRKEHRFAGPFPCFTQFNTMAEVLDRNKVSWKYYVTQHVGAGQWSAFEAIRYVRYGRDWKRNVISPQTKVLDDAAAGQLAAVSWVTPSKPDSDHPGDHSDQGPSWVSSVVNAIGEGPDWNSTAIIVLWDDWGGWYDNASPPQPDFRGLGIRVPCLIISPYARETASGQPGYISHTQYEFGSILKFIEEVNGLPYLGKPAKGYTDERANSLDDSFDFTQSPRPFIPIKSKYPLSHFLHEPPSTEAVDTE